MAVRVSLYGRKPTEMAQQLLCQYPGGLFEVAASAVIIGLNGRR